MELERANYVFEHEIEVSFYSCFKGMEEFICFISKNMHHHVIRYFLFNFSTNYCLTICYLFYLDRFYILPVTLSLSALVQSINLEDLNFMKEYNENIR